MQKIFNCVGILSTKQRVFLFILVALVFLLPLSIVVPPMQSPDEIAHTLRAYSLFDGEILPSKDEDGNRNLKSNKSLIEAFSVLSSLHFNYNVKYSDDMREKIKSIDMSAEHDPLFNVLSAYYFPLIYLPHAIALHAGDMLSLSVYTSYMLARFLAMLTSLLIFSYAFSLIKPNFLTIVMLLMPMYLFQLISATLDGISTAVSVLAISLFITIMRNDVVKWQYVLMLSVSVFLITTTRLNLIPLLLFIFIVSFSKRNIFALILSVITSILSLGWNLLVVFTAPIKTADVSFTDKIIYYLTSPIEFFTIIIETLKARTLGYGLQFIGKLGRLDIFLDTWYYIFAIVMFIVFLVLSFNKLYIRNNRSVNSTLWVTSIFSILLIFAALLVQWTDEFPAKSIIGVQGRYFLIPFLMLSYSLGENGALIQPRKRFNFIIVLMIIFFIISYYDMMASLVERYYFSDTPMLSILSAW